MSPTVQFRRWAEYEGQGACHLQLCDIPHIFLSQHPCSPRSGGIRYRTRALSLSKRTRVWGTKGDCGGVSLDRLGSRGEPPGFPRRERVGRSPLGSARTAMRRSAILRDKILTPRMDGHGRPPPHIARSKAIAHLHPTARGCAPRTRGRGQPRHPARGAAPP
jgi:hypothetical protein